MQDRDFAQNIYQNIRDIGEELLEFQEEHLEAEVEEELEAGLPGPERYHSIPDFQKASFGISYLLADSYAEGAKEIFYDERAEDFRGFAEELGHHNSGYSKSQLVQYHRLYRSIAKDEGLKVSEYPDNTLILQKKDDIADEVLEMLSDMSARLKGGGEKEILA